MQRQMTSQTRPTLLKHLRGGTDPLAWDEFFQRYWPVIYAFARRRGCSEHTAEEVIQDVMLKIFRQRDLFQYDPTRGRFRDWLGTVVRNQVAERRRRPSERVRARGGDSTTESFHPKDEDAKADAARPEQLWETAFENGLLTVMLDVVRREVNPRDYLAFELLAIRELPGAQVARITGLSRNAAYKARRRVLKRLRELGGTYDDDGRLTGRIREALQTRPAAAVLRSLTGRIEKTMRSR